MVLERLINPKKISGRPWEMFIIGAVYAGFSILLSWWVFKSYVSLIMITLTAIAAIPFVYRSIEQEEDKDASMKKGIFKEHSKVISVLTFLFLGFVFVFALTYLLLPGHATEEIFKVQIETIITINSSPTGNFISNLASFITILSNNLKIMFFCLLFSFFYGVGAIFILSWNASVMATAVGESIRQGLSSSFGANLQVIGLSVAGYFMHGIPEIMAYFTAGLAGGIISVAAIKEEFMGKRFTKVALDSVSLIGAAFLLLVISAFIEVVISPLFF